MSLSRLSPLFVACALAVACSPTFNWREARPDGRVVALFPCKPDRQARQVTIAGTPLTMQLVSCSTGDLTFALSYIDAPEVTQVTPLLQTLRTALLTNVGGPSSASAGGSAGGATVPGSSPHPLAQRLSAGGRRPDGQTLQAQGQFFCKDLRIYQATVVGQRLEAPVLEVFFSSLKLPA